MYNLWYCNIRDKSIVIESYPLNTVALYPSLFWLTPKDKRTQRQVLCIAVYLRLHLQHLTPRQTLRFIHPHLALPNITWGLICDSKNKKEGIPELNSSLDHCLESWTVENKIEKGHPKRE